MAFLGNHCAFAQGRAQAEAPLDFHIEQPNVAPCDAFMAHVFSCLLEIGLAESKDSSVGAVLGLNEAELSQLVATCVPESAARFARAPQPASIEFDEEEQQLRDLFERYRSDASRETTWLISALTRRSMAPNHLWQDLGLHSRDELNRLLHERFPRLAARNQKNMKWKKFFYRCLCELEGFTLCAAPSCSECADYASCFGEETGLARIAPRTA